MHASTVAFWVMKRDAALSGRLFASDTLCQLILLSASRDILNKCVMCRAELPSGAEGLPDGWWGEQEMRSLA